jgi:hypothetical protein
MSEIDIRKEIMLPFVAAVGDGHTRIHTDSETNEKQPAKSHP